MEGIVLALVVFGIAAAVRRWWILAAAAATGMAIAGWAVASVSGDDYLGDSSPGLMAVLGAFWIVALVAVAAAGVLFGRGLSARSRSRATPE